MYVLKQTCSSCPEQYEVFKNDKQCGYIRLRHHVFRVDYPDCGERVIFSTYLKDDDGCFANETKRQKMLILALTKISEYESANIS